MTPENIRDCDTCKHIEKSSDEYPCVACSSTEHYDSIYDMMPWIPCSERLPDDFGLYLASYMDYTGYHVNLLVFDPKEHFDVDFWKEEIDAWMPLPEPYKEKEDERTD